MTGADPGDPVPEGRPAEPPEPAGISPEPAGRAGEPGREPQGSAATQRLSLRTLLVHPVRQLGSLAVPLLALVVFGGALDAGRFIALPLVVAAVVATSLVRWLTFSYQVGEHHLDIVQGVLGRSTRSIPMDRIRGVDVTASPMHRLLGIAVVKIDAAAGGGGEAQEGELDAVTAAEAERLRVVLLHRSSLVAPEAGQPGEAEAGEAPQQPGVAAGSAQTPAGEAAVIARMRARWYLYAPVTGGYLFAPLALIGSLIGLLFELSGPTGVLSEQDLRQVFERGSQLPYVLLGVAGAGVLLVIPVLAVGMFAVVNWNFTLRRREGALVGERGLFTRRSVSLERDRIRGWELREGLVQRAVGAAALRAVVTGLGDAEQRGQLLPVAPRDQALSAAGRAVGPFEVPLLAHPPAARTRRLIRAVVPWAVAALVAALAGVRPLALALLALAVLGVPLGLDRYRSLGHAADARRLSVRSGSLLRQQAVIERRAVVGWTVRQTWLQRRVGLVTLVAGVGAGDGGYSAVDVGAAEAARFAAEVTPAWVQPVLQDDG